MSWSKWNGAQVKATMRAAALRGLQQWGGDVFDQSQQDVPVSPYARGGYLRDSGKMEADLVNGVVVISYDSPPDSLLAIWAHERVDVQHSTGKAKFLEDPLRNSMNTGPATVAAEIQKVLS